MYLKLFHIQTTEGAQSALFWILYIVHVNHVPPLIHLAAKHQQTQLARKMALVVIKRLKLARVHFGYMHPEPLLGVAHEVALIAQDGTAVVLAHVPLQLLGSDEEQFAGLAADRVVEVEVGFVHDRVGETALALGADEGDCGVEFNGVKLEQVGLGEHARAAGAVKWHLVFVAGTHVDHKIFL